MSDSVEMFIASVALGAMLIGFGYTIMPKSSPRVHRRSAHSYASIISNKTIQVTNLDDVDFAELVSHPASLMSSLKSREHVGNGEWIFHYQYMGDKRKEDFDDPVHLMYMRNEEAKLNQLLAEYTNKRKPQKGD